MKRSEMIDEIACVLLAYGATYPQYPLSNLTELAKEILKMQENKGMLPPTNACRIIPDEVRGGFKHSETKRAWDDEEVQS